MRQKKGRILTLPPIHNHELAANRSRNGLSPSPPLVNGREGRGEVALSYLTSGAVSSCAPKKALKTKKLDLSPAPGILTIRGFQST